MKKSLFFIFFIFSLLFIYSCNNKEIKNTNAQTSYKDIPFSKNDFIFNYNNSTQDVIDEHNNKETWWWQSYSTNDNVITNRNIKIGDDLSLVKEKYGDLELTIINKENNNLYKSWKEHDGESTNDFHKINDGDFYGEYIYSNNQTGKNYALGFFFDSDKKVKCILAYFGL